MIRIYLATFALLSGCANGGRVAHGDMSFTQEERTVLVQAFGEMSTNLGVEPIPIVWDGRDEGVRLLRRQPPIATNAGEYDVEVFIIWKEEIMYIRPGLELALVRPVAMHELGHVFGLPHHAGVGIMTDPAGFEWSEDDVASCRQHGLCR